MQNSVVKAAIKSRNSDLKNKIDLETIKNVLRSKGCAVLFYDPDEGNRILCEYKLEEYARAVEAFTFKKDEMRIVFVRSKVSCEDKLYLLLHEVGHVILRHAEKSALISNSRLQDFEADTFAYTVLNPPKHGKLTALTAWILTMTLCFASGFFYALRVQTAPESTYEKANEETFQTAPAGIYRNISEETNQTPAGKEELVYITKTGKKYHLGNCIYVRNKACIAVNRDEAQQTHEPCSVCKP